MHVRWRQWSEGEGVTDPDLKYHKFSDQMSWRETSEPVNVRRHSRSQLKMAWPTYATMCASIKPQGRHFARYIMSASILTRDRCNEQSSTGCTDLHDIIWPTEDHSILVDGAITHVSLNMLISACRILARPSEPARYALRESREILEAKVFRTR